LVAVIGRELSSVRKTSITVGDDLHFRKAFVCQEIR